jgi:hypothetical protein
MTIEELLRQQPQLGQGGASQYLSMPQQQYGASQYLGGLLGPELNFSAPGGTMPSYSTNTYQPGPWTYDKQNDIQGMLQQLANDNPSQGIWRLFALAPNSAWTKTG